MAMKQTHATPKKTMAEVEEMLRTAKHARRKFELTLELCRYMRRDLPRMLSLAESAYELSSTATNLGLFSRLQALWWVAYSHRLLQQHEQAIVAFKQAIELFESHGPDDFKGISKIKVETFELELYDNCAIEYFHIGNLEQALHLFTANLERAEHRGVSGGIVATQNSLGELWRTVGNVEKAFLHWSMAVNTSFMMKDLRRLAELYTNLAWTQEYYGNSTEAVELIEKAINHAKEYSNPYGLCAALLSRSRLYMKSKQWDLLVRDIEECLSTAREFSHLLIENQALLILAQAAAEQKDYSEAITYYESAYEKARERNEITCCVEACLGLAACHRNKRSYKKALTQAQNALHYADLLQSPLFMARAKRELADLESQRGNADQSNIYLRDYIQLQERINSEQHSADIREARLRLSLESAERERNELADRNRELENNLERKRAELATLAISISQKNAVIERLGSQIEQLAHNTETSNADKCKTIVSEIEALKNSGEKQWSGFQKQFEGLDSGFQLRLMELNRGLTQNEVKICMLMRLNLSTKDISNILWTSPRTVETHRYSIRKKLNLAKNDNLYTFLLRL